MMWRVFPPQNISNHYNFDIMLYLKCCTRAQDSLPYCRTSQRSPVTSDQDSNQQQVSPLPAIAQELLAACVLKVNVSSGDELNVSGSSLVSRLMG
jgi:hypothetical protein